MSQAGLSQQLTLVRQGLYDLGYHEPHGATIQDYRFITSEKQLGHADLLAFGDTQLCDINTSCIVVNALNNSDDQFSALKNNTFVGAPIALFVLPEHVEIWPVSTNFSNALQQQKKFSYEDLPEYFHTRGRELSPRSLLSAKRGARQLSLFDLDPSLVEFARDATQEILVRQFEVAIQAISVDIRKTYSKQLHRLAIWVLASRILQDKLHDYADLRTNDVLALLRAVQQRFPMLARIVEVVKASAQSSDQQRQVGKKPEEIRSDYVFPQAQWLSSPQWQMTSSPLGHIWEHFASKFLTIDPHYGKICNGVKPGKAARFTHFSSENAGSEWKLVLYDNSDGKILEPFQIRWDYQEIRYIKYPSRELERQRDSEHFARSSKVVINATRNPRSPWRFYAAIDKDQLVVTENFNYILPQKATSEEIAAVLNSMVANAWFASQTFHRDVTLESLKTLPFPDFNDGQQREIITLVGQITSNKKEPTQLDEVFRSYIERLDEIIFDAYELDKRERDQIRKWMGHFARPGREWKGVISPPQEVSLYQGREWILTGQIEAISSKRQKVTLWIVGQSDAVEMDIPPNMPGWALRAGTSFQASIPWAQRYPANVSEITWLRFQPNE